jgi:hypothetical protein
LSPPTATATVDSVSQARDLGLLHLLLVLMWLDERLDQEAEAGRGRDRDHVHSPGAPAFPTQPMCKSNDDSEKSYRRSVWRGGNSPPKQLSLKGQPNTLLLSTFDSSVSGVWYAGCTAVADAGFMPQVSTTTCSRA